MTSSGWLYQIVPGARWLQTKLNQVTSYVPPPPRESSAPLKILLVHAHPDPVHSFSAAIAQQVETSATEAGHEIRRISLYTSANKEQQDGYHPKLTKAEHASHITRGRDVDQRQLAKEVKQHIKHLQWCDTVIFVYPTWWMNTPAVLKGWLDRTLVHDLCWALPAPDATDKNLVPLLTNVKQIVGISTYGAPQHIVTLAGDNGRRMMANAVRPIMAPAATVSWLGLYGMDSTTHLQRTQFLQQVNELVREL